MIKPEGFHAFIFLAVDTEGTYMHPKSVYKESTLNGTLSLVVCMHGIILHGDVFILGHSVCVCGGGGGGGTLLDLARRWFTLNPLTFETCALFNSALSQGTALHFG